MRQDDRQQYYAWFDRYTGQFSSDDPLVAANLQAKAEHTKSVARTARAIADSLQMSDDQRALAEVLGLFHDLGRFPQLECHGTFRDAASFDHAAMSVRVLDEEDVWRHFTDRERVILTTAIRHHNKFAIPEACTGEVLLFCKLIRDADKLDGLRRAAEGHTFTLLMLDGDDVSPAVMKAILNHRCVRYTDIETQPDIIVAIVAQVYNVSFPYTLATIREEHYIDRIFARLPQNAEFARMQEMVQAFIDKRE